MLKRRLVSSSLGKAVNAHVHARHGWQLLASMSASHILVKYPRGQLLTLDLLKAPSPFTLRPLQRPNHELSAHLNLRPLLCLAVHFSRVTNFWVTWPSCAWVKTRGIPSVEGKLELNAAQQQEMVLCIWKVLRSSNTRQLGQHLIAASFDAAF